MAAVAVSSNAGASVGTVLGTTLQQLTPSADVDFIDVYCASDLFLVISASGADGGAIGSLARFLIPAGTVYPIPAGTHGTPIFVAAVAGTPTAYFFGVSRG